MNTTEKQIAFILTHKVDEKIIQLYHDVRKGFEKFGDVAFLLHDESGELNQNLEYPNFPFKYEQIHKLGFKMVAETLVPGSNHFPLILFSQQFPNYSNYWVIEFDVRFNGDWKLFFSDFATNDYDFCSCHLRMYSEEPEWPWWELVHPSELIPIENRIRSFNTTYKISSRALKFIDCALKNNWKGHHEVLLPSLLFNNNFKIMDFGGNGKFVMNGNENKYYTSSKSNPKGILFNGSMRFRPVIREYREGINKLYHPCK
jgi:hypothetical protein